VDSCWNLLVQTHARSASSTNDIAEDEPRFDGVVAAGLTLLTTIATSVFWNLFSAEGVLSSILTSVVLPNLRLREVDLELFEDNPVDYIRADVEGSDSGTRRRAATELVKGLRKHFENEVTAECAQHANQLLAAYQADAATQWMQKDIAIYLITALAARATTAEKGATQVSELIPLHEFTASQIQPELDAAKAAVEQQAAPESACASPVLLADALKFVTAFRGVFDKTQVVQQVFPSLMACLHSETYVVHSYAASAIEKFLVFKDDVVDEARTQATIAKLQAAGHPTDSVMPVTFRQNRFGSADIAPLLEPLITNLLRLLTERTSDNNEYVAKCLLRVLATADASQVAPMLEAIIGAVAAVITRVLGKSVNPTFNHFLFEIAAILGGYAGVAENQAAGQLTVMQTHLAPVFVHVIENINDLQDFSPYVFQLLAQMLELQTSDELWVIHAQVLPFVLSPHLWERAGSIPALVRLLRAYLKKGGDVLIQPTSGEEGSPSPLQGMLGVFQKLINTKLHDHEGFFILESMVEHLPIDWFNTFIPQILAIIFTRMQNQRMRTEKFVRSFLCFMSLFIGKHGTDVVASNVEQVQQGTFVRHRSFVFLLFTFL
jgi:exportin-2 (importin alpha re-exporter)